MHRDRPKVTVILPVYNAAGTVGAALGSILAQTLGDFDILAIDDGSSDGSGDVLRSITDRRVAVIRHDVNLGLVATLNEGLERARGEYIARMDADDVSLRRRFELQTRFLDANPAVGICGTWARRFGVDRRLVALPTRPEAIRAELLFHSAFVHPTVMLRSDLLRAHDLKYRGEVPIEDYALWRDACECFPTANLPRILLRYRVHAGSITARASAADSVARAVRDFDTAALRRLGIEPSEDDLTIHARLRSNSPPPPDIAEGWLRTLRDANGVVNYYARDEFDRAIAGRWFHVCNMAKGWGAVKLRRMQASDLSRGRRTGLADVARLVACPR